MCRLGAALVALAVFVAWPVTASADGDPPSDFLVQDGVDVYYPYTPPFTTAQKAALEELAQAARAGGVPLKVAIVASADDLGADPELFGKAQDYATFLAAEIEYAYTDTLLDVMPAGFGISTKQPALKAAVAGLKPPSPNGTAGQVAQCTADAMVKVAAAGGARLTAPRLGDCADTTAAGPGASSGSSSSGGPSTALLYGSAGGAAVVLLVAGGFLAVRRRR